MHTSRALLLATYPMHVYFYILSHSVLIIFHLSFFGKFSHNFALKTYIFFLIFLTVITFFRIQFRLFLEHIFLYEKKTKTKYNKFRQRILKVSLKKLV